MGIAGMCLDVDGAVGFDGNFVQIWVCNGTLAQEWFASAGGTLQVVNRCLRVMNEATNADARVEIWGCDGSAAQQWRFANGAIVNPATGLCLSGPRDATAPGTRLVGTHCQSTAGQRWNPPPVA
ncbi:RICIN domain-containing protein [Dactylosporangium sp. NPDC005572]|uniref:RICIN domain-containing protein n=1 Tax=Dactylosporangium sp. NPDC005572 TaxID=3156889 RepID=UPI0033AEDC7B